MWQLSIIKELQIVSCKTINKLNSYVLFETMQLFKY